MRNPNTACRVALQEVQKSKTLDERLELQRWSWELGKLTWRSSAIQVFLKGLGVYTKAEDPLTMQLMCMCASLTRNLATMVSKFLKIVRRLPKP